MRGPDGETRREEFAFFNSQGLKNFLFFCKVVLTFGLFCIIINTKC